MQHPLVHAQTNATTAVAQHPPNQRNRPSPILNRDANQTILVPQHCRILDHRHLGHSPLHQRCCNQRTVQPLHVDAAIVQPATEAPLMTLGKLRSTAYVDTPFRQVDAVTTNHPASPSKPGFADGVDLSKHSIDPTSRIVDDRDGRFAWLFCGCVVTFTVNR